MYEPFLKRLLDIVLSALALLLVSPLMLVVAAAIVLEDGGSPLFLQKRVGRNGRPFRLMKFRSMPVNTEDRPSAHAGELKITRVGKFIRRTNIDELPQLINILKGDMSIVGPRPALPTQSNLLTLREQGGAMRLRPGLTGLAQVNSYDGMPETEKANWDVRYASRISFWKDFWIIVRTFGYLLRRPPIY